MALSHGKDTVITVETTDLSQYTKESELGRTADSHDVTTYGKNSHVKAGGLLDGKFTMGGVYDTTAATGPRGKLEPLLGTVVDIVRQPEGAGAGKPQDAFAALLVDYTESNPVADYVSWKAEFELSDDVDSTVQA